MKKKNTCIFEDIYLNICKEIGKCGQLRILLRLAEHASPLMTIKKQSTLIYIGQYQSNADYFPTNDASSA
jgi:hypothetical protein